MDIYELRVTKNKSPAREKWTEAYYLIPDEHRIRVYALHGTAGPREVSDTFDNMWAVNLHDGGDVSFRKLRGQEEQRVLLQLGGIVPAPSQR